jgi:hypothetical protein
MKKFDPQHFRSAVMTIAMMRAKKAAQAQLRARGLKPQHYSSREIVVMAEAYLGQHREELISKAAADVATFPEFARHLSANLLSDAQKEKPSISTTSTLQISGAK